MARKRIAAASRLLAARSMSPREKQAAEMAQEVYDEVYYWRQEQDAPVILAPVSVAARRIAPLALQEAGIEQTDENLEDAAALIVLGLVEAARSISGDDLVAFRAGEDR